MIEKKKISFVIPCYRGENTIGMVIEEIIKTMEGHSDYDYEIIAVNDCSPDNEFLILEGLAAEYFRIKVIDLAKNAGKHNAMMAGYTFAKGDYIVNLDDDYQCPVYNLWELIAPLEHDECDCSTAVYTKKKESLWKRVGSRFNHLVTQILLDKPQNIRIENFSAIKRFVRDEILNYENPFPYIEGLILQTTRRIQMVPMEERNRGDCNTSGFTFRNSLALFSNGLTAFSVKPLRISSLVGVIFSLLGFIYGIYVIVHKLLTPSIAIGYSSMVAILLFSTGMIMMMLGMIGEYVGRIYICINNSPQYVIKRKINIDEVGHH